MRIMKRSSVNFVIILTQLWLVGVICAERPQTAVFNFGMAKGSDEWRWLEKGLADMLTNDILAANYPVVARDEMQAVAMQAGWDKLKELEERMGAPPLLQVNNALKIERLISGAYKIENEKIQIITQIVDPESGNLLKQIQTEGPIEDILTLRHDISRELIPWLNMTSGEGEPNLIYEIRPAPWSQSVDAMRALYEGIDLYDQGLYPEAWLKFRQAEKNTAGFADAIYWAAKMDYFQSRYEHSRHDFETFLNQYPSHPQVGSAVREYMHSWENVNPNADQLLTLYEHMKTAFPDAKQLVGTQIHPNYKWSEWRSMRLQASLNDLEKALKHTPKNSSLYGGTDGETWRLTYLKEYLSKGGRDKEILNTAITQSKKYKILKFNNGQRQLVDNNHPYGRGLRLYYLLVPPEGKLFESLRVWPISANGYHTKIRVLCSQVRGFDIFDSKFGIPLHLGRREGIKINAFEKAPVAHLYLDLNSPSKPPYDKSKASIEGVRLEATFKDIPEAWGSLDINCSNATNFKVEGNGEFIRSGSGVVDYLAPGTYRLQFTPGTCPYTNQIHYASFERDLTIKAGETTRLEIKFPWRNPVKWEGWEVGKIEHPQKMKYDLDLRTWNPQNPQFVFTEDKIRVLWCDGGNIWTCESNDGLTFTNTRKIDLPVSSGWHEGWVKCRIDSLNRFVMTFLSNRNKEKTYQLYSCWSRDFINWTSPRQVKDSYVDLYDLGVDPKSGNLVIAESAGTKQVNIWTSKDAINWLKIKTLDFEGAVYSLSLLTPLSGQGFEIYATVEGQIRYFGPSKIHWRYDRHIMRIVSQDLIDWEFDDSFKPICKNGRVSTISATHSKDDDTIVCSTSGEAGANLASFFRLTQDDSVKRVDYHNIFLTYDSSLAYHPKWGACVAWSRVKLVSNDFLPPKVPLIIMRGPDFNPFFSKK